MSLETLINKTVKDLREAVKQLTTSVDTLSAEVADMRQRQIAVRRQQMRSVK